MKRLNVNNSPFAGTTAQSFPAVSRAFQVLSGMVAPLSFYILYTLRTDPQKRAAFDSGTDPEDRLGGMGSRGFPTSFRNGASFNGELSPEDLFNMFFGGAGGNGFNSGGPGLFRRIHWTAAIIHLHLSLHVWSWWIPNHIHGWW